ncbi:DUF2500 domain-containing protein [Streptococcus pneumoniae]
MDPVSMMPTWFLFIVITILGIFLWRVATSIFEGMKNSTSPQEVAEATVISKRMHVGGSETAYTSYYLTFELINGERREFRVKSQVYALSVEGDKGELSFQGTRFLDFRRR